MNEFQPLIDQLRREEVERARRMTPEQRIAAAFELSNLWFANSDPELARRLKIIKDRENRMYYGLPQPLS